MKENVWREIAPFVVGTQEAQCPADKAGIGYYSR